MTPDSGFEEKSDIESAGFLVRPLASPKKSYIDLDSYKFVHLIGAQNNCDLDSTRKQDDVKQASRKQSAKDCQRSPPSPPTATHSSHKCHICQKTFSANSNLNKHLRRVHSQHVHSSYNNVRCALCNDLLSSSAMYIRHLESLHKVAINIQRISFKTQQAFQEWKNSVEQATTSQYIKSRGQKRSTDKNKTYYNCNRSGYFVSKARTGKAFKRKGTRKINGRCPAAIYVTVNHDSSCDVKFVKTHVGHDLELEHLDLSERDRELILRQLRSGVPKRDIISNLRSATEAQFVSGESCVLVKPIEDTQRDVTNGRSNALVDADNDTVRHSDHNIDLAKKTKRKSKSVRKSARQKPRPKNELPQESQQPRATSRIQLATSKDIHNILSSKPMLSAKIKPLENC